MPRRWPHAGVAVTGDNLKMSQPPVTKQIPLLVEQLYEPLKKEIWLLHSRWVLFEQLYRKSDLRLELLNEANGSFFHMLQWLMYDDLQLGLAKLTDDRRDTASLPQLQKRLDSQSDNKLAAQAKAVLVNLSNSVEAIRKQRDSRIAHYSLDQATNGRAEKLPDVNYHDIVAALGLVRDYMNLIETYYHDGWSQGYEHFAWDEDGETLVEVLRCGLRYLKWRMEQEVFFEPRDKWTDA